METLSFSFETVNTVTRGDIIIVLCVFTFRWGRASIYERVFREVTGVERRSRDKAHDMR
jgi:hypothetical protein